MKFLSTITLLLVSSSLTFVIACEKDCREGVAKAFADKYTPAVNLIFEGLRTLVDDKLFSSIQTPPEFLAAVPIDLLEKALKDAIDAGITTLDSKFQQRLPSLMHSTIFNEDPKFRGDCNHPKRLPYNMPPEGESWTLKHCTDMDYICGNPPSICHFLEKIKTRCANNIRTRLQTNGEPQSGSFYRDLLTIITSQIKATLITTGHGALLDDTATKVVEDAVVQNLVGAMQAWRTQYVDNFCTSEDQLPLCNSWDDEIKPVILSYP
ncbi:hypothetical protein BC937DRAFT_91399 [Endogone sp. FLAS-F59071]|nr:hypothetical protein BC937DRAFT_91399 [Endogone sp. FLAS-F59071]|eukprot:RUS21807.1 hypothetical protein BC937DRAFT_91399 [Endogone sp. FLAS-F59071]